MSDEINANEITILGETNFRNQRRSFGIYADDRRRHVYVVGKTGVGKSTLLENMIIQDIEQGRGVCYVDPHGDTVEKLLENIPPHRVNDVVYFDPSDVDYPVAFNVLEAFDPQYKYLIASGLVGSLKKIWADSWGPRLEYILRNTILALLDYPSSTILGILRMLSDKAYRKKVVDTIEDPVVKAFWTTEFANYNERFRTEAISPIQNKVGQLLSSSIIRNIIAQPKSTINVAEIMDQGKILLVNVSKGKIGEDNSGLLGAMLINRIQLAAMDRASIPEEERKDFYLYVDEFQNFATESFADILSEARKYRLNLTIAHQYVAQMEEEVIDAVFGNVGTIVSFRVGATDAEYLEKEFVPVFLQSDLVNLDKYNAYIKLMINGISSRPFSMRTLAPGSRQYNRGDIVRKVSRERFGRKRTVVEEKIRQWSGTTLEEKGKDEKDDQAITKKVLAPQKKEVEDVILKASEPPITDLATALRGEENKVQKHQERYEITCSRCGKQADVPFKPTQGKPAYCKECWDHVRKEKIDRIETPLVSGGVPPLP
jgi:CxxC-x17-CxxC domain-containing protein